MTILSNGHLWKHSEFIENKNFSFNKNKILSSLSKKEIDDAYLSISSWEGYSPTPLIELDKLSKELNLNKIFYKDESKRFDLKSFKALGGAYAVEKVSNGNKDIVVATATAGNHGRSVAWGARRLGLKCKIFISEFVSDARGQAMASRLYRRVSPRCGCGHSTRTGEKEISPSIREAPMPGYMPTASSHESSRQQNTRWYGLHPSVPVHCESDRMICELLGWSGTGGSSALMAPKTMRFKLACSLSIWLWSIAKSAFVFS